MLEEEQMQHEGSNNAQVSHRHIPSLPSDEAEHNPGGA